MNGPYPTSATRPPPQPHAWLWMSHLPSPAHGSPRHSSGLGARASPLWWASAALTVGPGDGGRCSGICWPPTEHLGEKKALFLCGFCFPLPVSEANQTHFIFKHPPVCFGFLLAVLSGSAFSWAKAMQLCHGRKKPRKSQGRGRLQ